MRKIQDSEVPGEDLQTDRYDRRVIRGGRKRIGPPWRNRVNDSDFLRAKVCFNVEKTAIERQPVLDRQASALLPTVYHSLSLHFKTALPSGERAFLGDDSSVTNSAPI